MTDQKILAFCRLFKYRFRKVYNSSRNFRYKFYFWCFIPLLNVLLFIGSCLICSDYSSRHPGLHEYFSDLYNIPF
jgi:hypothetical protein